MIKLKRIIEDRVFGKIRNDHAYVYMGIFVDDVPEFYNMISSLLKENGIERHSYDKEIKDPHVTIRHITEKKPFLDDLFGQKINVTITHYGYDDELGNEGVKVSFNNLPDIPELKDMIQSNGEHIGGMDKYHITLSIRNGSKAKNTKSIKNWEELDVKKTIEMVIDGFD